MKYALSCAHVLALFVVLNLLAGFSLEAEGKPPTRDEVAGLRKQIEALLDEEITTHWYPHSIDRELGGFHQNMGRDWSLLADDNRFLVYQARMTWTAAAFALHSPKRRAEYTQYARDGVKYLDQVMRDAEFGGFHWVLSPHGDLDPKLGGEKHVYGIAFVLYAASQVHVLARDADSLRVARDAFAWLEKHAHDSEQKGYFEAFNRAGKPILVYDPAQPISQRTDRLGVYHGFKSMNSHIHLLEALAEFYKIEKTSEVERRLSEVHSLVRDRIAVEPGALCLYFTRDWKPVPAHDSFGHDIETAYLLVDAAEALGIPKDERTWKVARGLVDHALDWGWDDRDGGFHDKGDAFAGGPLDTTKVWWTQAEGLNALLLMHMTYGVETNRYWDAFRKQWSFIENHQIDREQGGWFGELTREGKLIGGGPKATQWKANYHTSRAMMNVVAMLEKLEHN